MISGEKNFLFIHIPKTGGNSLQNILRNYSEDKIMIFGEHQDGIERFEVRNDKYDVTKHSTLQNYKDILEPNFYQKLFKFATLRNPYDRMISWYFSPHRGVKEWIREDFIKLVGEVSPVRHYIGLSESLSQQKTFNFLGFSFTLNQPNLDQDIDFLIRFESLEQDFKKVCEMIDIPYEPLPIRNKSERRSYASYFDQELKEIVEEKFAEEIKFGAYEFDN
ncbi:MAG: sulfotransferase family 2 domain-containing protein [Crocosphaera sp.]